MIINQGVVLQENNTADLDSLLDVHWVQSIPLLSLVLVAWQTEDVSFVVLGAY